MRRRVWSLIHSFSQICVFRFRSFEMASVALVMILFFSSISPCFGYPDVSSPLAWKSKWVLLSYAWTSYPTLVDAIPPIEESKKLKEKIKKGTELLEDLNAFLEEIRGNLKIGIPIDQTTLAKMTNIKDKFAALQVDPTDLSKDLLENFRDRTLEAFKLILLGFNVENFPFLKKLEESKAIQNPEINDLRRPFGEEL